MPKKKRPAPPHSLRLPIVAQDPSVRTHGNVLLDDVEVPKEKTGPGPRGSRIYVVDYDASGGHFYQPARLPALDEPRAIREYKKRLEDPDTLERDPSLHAINAYSTAMSALGRFERALGRRIAWGFGGHQIHLAPHAFADANAYYSEDDHALLFGYFPSSARGRKMVFTCLSHDVVAHETGHALLDGLRTRYTMPSSPDQAAFHEGFADLIALLSVFSMSNAVRELLGADRNRVVRARQFEGAWLENSPLLAMAEQFGTALDPTPHRRALRASLLLTPSPRYYKDSAEFGEEHRRAEILVAAVLRAFVEMWKHALYGDEPDTAPPVPLDVIVSEGAVLAERVMMMVIRAIDYAPVQDIHFGDYLNALLTADREVYPGDEKYKARQKFLDAFAEFGIEPASDRGLWDAAEEDLRYDHVHAEALRHDPNEVFRFLWENRKPLNLYEPAYTQVISVRPCTRRGSDGFLVNETVCEYLQSLTLRADELSGVTLDPRSGQKQRERLNRPEGLDDAEPVTLRGGGVLLFDEAGRLKYHIANRVRSWRQNERLAALAAAGRLGRHEKRTRAFARLHQAAATRWANRPFSSSPSPDHRHSIPEIW